MNEGEINNASGAEGTQPERPTAEPVNGNGKLNPTELSSVKSELDERKWAVMGKDGIILRDVSHHTAFRYVRDSTEKEQKDMTVTTSRAALEWLANQLNPKPREVANWTEIQRSIK